MPAPPGPHPRTDGGQRHDLSDTTESRHTRSASPKKGLQTTITAEIAAEVEQLIGEGSLDGFDFEAVETAARQMALRVAGQAVAQRLNADHSDEQGPWLACGCGAAARYAGRRPRTITTALGPMTLRRAWYHCERCAEGFAPRDRTLGLDSSSLSPAALRMTGITAARLSFADSSELLQELAGLPIEPKLVERQAEALGRAIAEDERQVIEPEPSEARTLYLGLDGTGVPVRKTETQGKKGKQPDGSAKTREAKIAALWSADARDQHGSPARDPGSVSYNAAIGTVAILDTDTALPPFAQRILREIKRRRFLDAPRQVVLGDGAAWIWNFAEEHLPGAIQIVDIFHAKGHLFDAAKAIYGPGTDFAAAWGKQRRDELDQGRFQDLLAALEEHADSCDEAKKTLDYFTNNRKKMRYSAFRAQGLCVSTGVLEGGCKSVIAARLKNGGMHWTVDGANAVIALRCAIRSNRFDDFWERRAAG